MFHLFYKYLIFYNYVNIPGVGHFKIDKQPAETDSDNHLLHAPFSVIKFNNEANAADRSFYNFIANEMNIEVVEAIRQFQDFSSNLKNNLTSQKVVDLPSMGTLKMVNNEINFQAHSPVDEFYPAINVDELKLYRDTTSEGEALLAGEENEKKAGRSYWWLYALLLTLIAAAAIFYHYYQGGFD